MRWFSQRRSRTPHFGGGVRTSGLWPPNLNLAEIFVQCIYSPQVLSYYVYSFGSYRVDKQTNRRRWKHSPFFSTLRRLVKNYCSLSTYTYVRLTKTRSFYSRHTHTMLLTVGVRRSLDRASGEEGRGWEGRGGVKMKRGLTNNSIRNWLLHAVGGGCPLLFLRFYQWC